jgi:hypothetical protein
VQVFSDATITVPVIVQALKASGYVRKSYPAYEWTESGLKLKYERR